MPTAATDTYTYDALMPFANPDKASLVHVPLAVGTYAKGTVLGEITASGLYVAYATAAGDGSGTARGILQYACSVDASNNITIADGRGITAKTAPMYVAGQGCWFQATDLTGLDADALVDLHATIIKGTVSSGVIAI